MYLPSLMAHTNVHRLLLFFRFYRWQTGAAVCQAVVVHLLYLTLFIRFDQRVWSRGK